MYRNHIEEGHIDQLKPFNTMKTCRGTGSGGSWCSGTLSEEEIRDTREKWSPQKRTQIGDKRNQKLMRIQQPVTVPKIGKCKNRYVPLVTLLICPSSFWMLLPGDTVPVLANLITQLELWVFLILGILSHCNSAAESTWLGAFGRNRRYAHSHREFHRHRFPERSSATRTHFLGQTAMLPLKNRAPFPARPNDPFTPEIPSVTVATLETQLGISSPTLSG